MKIPGQIATMILLASSMAGGQMIGKSSSLRGKVLDDQAKPVDGASVAVLLDGRLIAQETTDAAGGFTFDGVAHEYKVQVKGAGYDDLDSAPVPFSPQSVSLFTITRPGGRRPLTVKRAVQEAAGGLGWDYGALTQGGFGLNDRSNYSFFAVGGHAGKLLAHGGGSSLLQGSFEYAVEVFPFWQAYTPRFNKISCTADPGSSETNICSQPYQVGGTYTGVSVTPIILRWNFTHGQRWMPWVQGAGGLLWTDHKFPAIGDTHPNDTASNGPHGDTSVWNFTPQFGVGAHYFVRSRRSIDLSANAVHISSASLGDKNPGVNASVQFSLGYSWWK